MGKKSKDGNFWKNIWSSTRRKIALVFSSITIFFPQIFRFLYEVIQELTKDRFTGWGNSMIDTWIATLPDNLLTKFLSFIFSDILNLVSSIGLVLLLYIIWDAWRITKKQIISSPVEENKSVVEVDKPPYFHKSISFQQHWFYQDLIGIVSGDQDKGIGIRVNNEKRTIKDMQANMIHLFFKKNESEEFKEISVETNLFWWDLGNKYSVTLEELSPDSYGILMLGSPVSLFPHFVFMTSSTYPKSNFSGIPRHNGYYKVYIQFKGLIFVNKNLTRMKPILFKAEFKYENSKFSEFNGKGYVTEID